MHTGIRNIGFTNMQNLVLIEINIVIYIESKEELEGYIEDFNKHVIFIYTVWRLNSISSINLSNVSHNPGICGVMKGLETPDDLSNIDLNSHIIYCIVLYCIVLMGWSLLPNALQPFQDLLCSPEFRYY